MPNSDMFPVCVLGIRGLVMGVIQDVIMEEYQRLNALVKLYDEKISHYPKGCISRKKRGNLFFCYLSYRDHGKVKSDYLGREESEKVCEMINKIKQRQQYEKMRRKSLDNLKEIKGYIRVSL